MNEQMNEKPNRNRGVICLSKHNSAIEIKEIDYEFGDGNCFCFGIEAYDTFSNKFMGFAGFKSDDLVARIDESFLALEMLLVYRDYQRQGVGTVLLDYAKEMAHRKGKIIILHPQRPRGNYSWEDFPLSDEQLKIYYLNRGFREFSPEEIESYGRIFDGIRGFTDVNLWPKTIVDLNKRYHRDILREHLRE